MITLNKLLTIELKSNLCASSGASLGSLIDCDICYDEYGLAYIPSKRIKGLLKEAIEKYYDIVKDEDILKISKKLFGIANNNNSSSLIIDNAYLVNSDAIKNNIDLLDDQYKKYLTKQRVINTNTLVKYQTKVDDYTGVASDNSLRSMRVLNKGNIFVASIEIENEEELKVLQIATKLVTHMGMSRTRGFGEVLLSLKDNEINEQAVTYQFDDDVKYEIELLFKADSNILITKENSLISEDYIKGSNIMGNIANSYIKDKNIKDFKTISEEYIDLFLNGKVLYKNAYITDKNGLLDYYKTPLSYTKVKNEVGRYHNKMFDVKEENIQLSNLDNKYVTLDENNYITSVKTSEQTHHQRPNDKSIGHVSKDDGILYQLVSIDMNQYFKSKIIGSGKYLKLILKYLKINKSFRVGKSKNTEYGKLTIKNIKINKIDDAKNNYKHFALILTSPLILFDEDKKRYANSKESLINELKKALNINIDPEKTFISYGVESGYNTIWNMPKEQLPSYDAGTTIVFNSKDKIELNKEYTLGTRTNEGYGSILIYNLDDKTSSIIDLKEYEEPLNKIDGLDDKTKEILKISISNVIKEEMLANALERLKPNYLNNTSIGRVLLMIKESNTYEELKNNINAIKDNKKLNKVLSIVEKSDLTNINAYRDYTKLFSISDKELDKFKLDYVKELFLVLKIIGGSKND